MEMEKTSKLKIYFKDKIDHGVLPLAFFCLILDIFGNWLSEDIIREP